MSENAIGNSAPAAEPTPSAPAAAPATSSAVPAQPSAAPATPNAAPQTPATGGPEGWVPSYRIREAREAAERQASQQYAQREAEIRAEADRYRQQLHSLVGVTPPQNPEVAAIKAQFNQLFPGLSKFEERAADLERILERAGDLESQNDHYWQSYGRQQVNQLFNLAEASLGTSLNDEAKRMLHSNFVGFVQSSPELTARYANDPKLVEDFWKAFSSGFIDPVRRTSTAQVVNRAPGALPQDTPSGAPRVPGPPQAKDLDERAANAWLQYQQTAKQ